VAWGAVGVAGVALRDERLCDPVIAPTLQSGEAQTQWCCLFHTPGTRWSPLLTGCGLSTVLLTGAAGNADTLVMLSK
jgi:hypothetical protein